MTWRQGGLFAAGLVLGIAAGAWGVHQWRTESPGAAPIRTATPQLPPARTAQASGTPCPGQPLLAPAAGGKDGQFDVLADFASNRPADIAAFLVLGKEAAASGRPRDAEVAFLMSCRLAQKLGAPAEQVADAKYQLGRHYAAQLAQSGRGKGDELRQRARSLYEESGSVYVASLGAQHEKSRFANEGLAALAPGPTVAAAPAPAPPPPTRTMGAAAPMPQAGKNAAAGPSFDCSRAHSVPERIICRDSQLSQLDRELARLHAKAKRAAPDAADFKRRSDESWKTREASCRDRECLLGWYAMRRDELLDELGPDATSAAR